MDNELEIKSTTESVGIKAFGSAVSSYIRKAALGVKILISDHGKVVAQLIKPAAETGLNLEHPVLVKWANSGLLRPAISQEILAESGFKPEEIEIPKVKLKKISSNSLLDQIRGE